ncbi:helix-turn-helix domain-containing protein [Dactylosporangium vinaceum]|nr:helix-turn-helix domain-containing protein [Dactylosporangium vinaceum]
MDVLAALADPRRRAVYELVAAAGDDAVSRDRVAEALEIGRNLAAHHLDKLAEAGLLEVEFARLSGRNGPGAGRPSKLYRRSATEHSVSLPPREYRVLAEVFAEAVAEAGVEPVLYAAARRTGARIAQEAMAAAARADSGAASVVGSDSALSPRLASSSGSGAGLVPVEATLRELGYEPYADGAVWRLRNCPFDSVARTHPGVVCGANLALLQGAFGDRVRIDPGPLGCCVVVDRAESGAEGGTKNNGDLF